MSPLLAVRRPRRLTTPTSRCSADVNKEMAALKGALADVEGELLRQTAAVSELRKAQASTQDMVAGLLTRVAALEQDHKGLRNEVSRDAAASAALLARAADLVPPNPTAPDAQPDCRDQGERTCEPSVESAGGDIVLSAPAGAVKVVAAECRESINLCDLSQLARDMQRALNELGDSGAR